jgi:molybdopterin synthase sulfur carrier subunit
MEWKLFADLADAAGDRTVTVEDAETVGDALDRLLDGRPALRERVLADGELAGHVNLLKNGEEVALDDPVAPGDELALFPPVSGG